MQSSRNVRQTEKLHPLTWWHVEGSFSVFKLQANCSFNAKRYRNHNVFCLNKQQDIFFCNCATCMLGRMHAFPSSAAKWSKKQKKLNKLKGEISCFFSVQHKFSQIPKWRKGTLSTKRDVQCCSVEWGMQKQKKKGIQRSVLTLVDAMKTRHNPRHSSAWSLLARGL